MRVKINHESFIFRSLILYSILAIVVLSQSCSKKLPKDKFTDTPTTGKVSIAVDETFQPIMNAELSVFHAMYRYATITPKYLPELDALNLLLRDSVRLAIVSRPLNRKEMNYFHSKKFFPHEVPVAVDGIAVLVNPANPDSLLTMKQLRSMMTGETTNWKQLRNGSKLGEIHVVFDNQNSSIVRLVVDSITKNAKLGRQLSAMTYNLDVVDYVSKNPAAIGLIGVSWISKFIFGKFFGTRLRQYHYCKDTVKNE